MFLFNKVYFINHKAEKAKQAESECQKYYNHVQLVV